MTRLRSKKKFIIDGYTFVREGGYYRRGSADKNNPERWLHRYIYHKNRGPIPPGFQVHHKDGNPENNEINNLETIKHKQHRRQKHSGTRTFDNLNFEDKVLLREDLLERIKKKNIKVLDAFGGDGLVWTGVLKNSGKNIQVLRIDRKKDKKGAYLRGDNKRLLKSLDLGAFDIIDLDAYGSPFVQLSIIFEKRFRGFVVCTYIKHEKGRIPKKQLQELGYPEEMIKRAPEIFYFNGQKKLEKYLYKNGVRRIVGLFFERKNFFYFKI